MSHTPLHASLSETLALLRAVHWNAWVTHWKSAGPDSYSDHLLFQRIYTADGGGPDIEAETDGLGERMIALFGQDGVDAVAVQERSAALLRGVGELPAIGRALKLEALLLLELTRAVRLCEKTDIALDNFLRTIADERSTVIYLLQQRQKNHESYGDVGLSEKGTNSFLVLVATALVIGSVWHLSSQTDELVSAR